MTTICRLCGEIIGPDREECPGGDGMVVELNPRTLRRASMHLICLQWAIDGLTSDERDRYNHAVASA